MGVPIYAKDSFSLFTEKCSRVSEIKTELMAQGLDEQNAQAQASYRVFENKEMEKKENG